VNRIDVLAPAEDAGDHEPVVEALIARQHRGGRGDLRRHREDLAAHGMVPEEHLEHQKAGVRERHQRDEKVGERCQRGLAQRVGRYSRARPFA
jgi:hypothetical protein